MNAVFNNLRACVNDPTLWLYMQSLHGFWFNCTVAIVCMHAGERMNRSSVEPPQRPC